MHQIVPPSLSVSVRINNSFHANFTCTRNIMSRLLSRELKADAGAPALYVLIKKITAGALPFLMPARNL